jgi:hypothetical protein
VLSVTMQTLGIWRMANGGSAIAYSASLIAWP